MSDALVKVQNFGFSTADAAALVREYGDDVVELVAKALENGLSKDLVVEVLQLGGKIALQLLVEWKAAVKPLFGNTVVEGDRVDFLPGFDDAKKNVIGGLLEKFLPQLLEKLAPVLLEKFGPLLTDLLLKLLSKK